MSEQNEANTVEHRRARREQQTKSSTRTKQYFLLALTMRTRFVSEAAHDDERRIADTQTMDGGWSAVVVAEQWPPRQVEEERVAVHVQHAVRRFLGEGERRAGDGRARSSERTDGWVDVFFRFG